MGKFERLDQLLSENKGYLRTSDAVAAGVSKSTLAAYVRENGLERTAHGLYMSKEIIERQMHGKLYDEQGEFGARFVIELPFV